MPPAADIGAQFTAALAGLAVLVVSFVVLVFVRRLAQHFLF